LNYEQGFGAKAFYLKFKNKKKTEKEEDTENKEDAEKEFQNERGHPYYRPKNGLTGPLTDLLTYISRSLIISFFVPMSLIIGLYVFNVPYLSTVTCVCGSDLPFAIYPMHNLSMGVNSISIQRSASPP
jgi:hypothetical protein